MREKAINWWNGLSFEDKFFKTIQNNDLIVGDKTRHPNTLTGREIETIWKTLNQNNHEKDKKN